MEIPLKLLMLNYLIVCYILYDHLDIEFLVQVTLINNNKITKDRPEIIFKKNQNSPLYYV